MNAEQTCKPNFSVPLGCPEQAQQYRTAKSSNTARRFPTCRRMNLRGFGLYFEISFFMAKGFFTFSCMIFPKALSIFLPQNVQKKGGDTTNGCAPVVISSACFASPGCHDSWREQKAIMMIFFGWADIHPLLRSEGENKVSEFCIK